MVILQFQYFFCILVGIFLYGRVFPFPPIKKKKPVTDSEPFSLCSVNSKLLQPFFIFIFRLSQSGPVEMCSEWCMCIFDLLITFFEHFLIFWHNKNVIGLLCFFAVQGVESAFSSRSLHFF